MAPPDSDMVIIRPVSAALACKQVHLPVTVRTLRMAAPGARLAGISRVYLDDNAAGTGCLICKLPFQIQVRPPYKHGPPGLSVRDNHALPAAFQVFQDEHHPTVFSSAAASWRNAYAFLQHIREHTILVLADTNGHQSGRDKERHVVPDGQEPATPVPAHQNLTYSKAPSVSEDERARRDRCMAKLSELNAAGLSEAMHLLELLAKVPSYQIYRETMTYGFGKRR